MLSPVRRLAIVLIGLFVVTVAPGSPTFAGKIARYDADTPTAVLAANCDLLRGQWSVSWRLWPHGDARFVVSAEVTPFMSQGGYFGPIGPESDGPKTVSAVLLPAGAVSVMLSVRYWPEDNPSTVRSYVQTETLGECVKGIVRPQIWGAKYCGGEASVELRNESDATLDALFRVTASPSFDAQYRVPPGQRVVLYFRQPEADPIKIYERGSLFLTVGPWFENEGCAIGKGPYCPCDLSGGTPGSGPIAPPDQGSGPGPVITGSGRSGSVAGGSDSADLATSAGPSASAPASPATTPGLTRPSTSDSAPVRSPSLADSSAAWSTAWPVLGLMGTGLAAALGIGGYAILRRRRTIPASVPTGPGTAVDPLDGPATPDT